MIHLDFCNICDKCANGGYVFGNTCALFNTACFLVSYVFNTVIMLLSTVSLISQEIIPSRVSFLRKTCVTFCLWNWCTYIVLMSTVTREFFGGHEFPVLPTFHLRDCFSPWVYSNILGFCLIIILFVPDWVTADLPIPEVLQIVVAVIFTRHLCICANIAKC